MITEALSLFPGGVNSPIRAYRAVGGGIDIAPRPSPAPWAPAPTPARVALQGRQVADIRADDRETARIARTPYHPLRIGGDELAMPIEQGAVGADDDHRIVERPATELALALVHAAHDDGPALRRGLA